MSEIFANPKNPGGVVDITQFCLIETVKKVIRCSCGAALLITDVKEHRL